MTCLSKASIFLNDRSFAGNWWEEQEKKTISSSESCEEAAIVRIGLKIQNEAKNQDQKIGL